MSARIRTICIVAAILLSTRLMAAAIADGSPPITEPQIVYVDDDAPVPGDGASWQTAYRFLQDAMIFASAGQEIRVAQGEYQPDLFALSDRPNRGRYETFALISGVAIRGGYAGIGAADPNARDIDEYQTTLTGDLLRNDSPYPLQTWEAIRFYCEDPNRDDNCYSVVTAENVDANAILEGFTISGGQANIFGDYGPGPAPNEPDPYRPENTGAGLYIKNAGPTIKACSFRNNTAISYQADTGGGAIFGIDATAAITDCAFIQNPVCSGDVASMGGAIRSIDSNLTLTGCKFSQNIAQGFDSEYYGGAIYNLRGEIAMTGCSFNENKADWGGAIKNEAGVLELTGCDFTANTSNDTGGAITSNGPTSITACSFKANETYIYGGAVIMSYPASLTITDSTFTANSASMGGALTTISVSPTVTDCRFVENTAGEGGAVFNFDTAPQGPTYTDCTFTANQATERGGAVLNDESNPTFTRCAFVANHANVGGAVAGDYDPKFFSCLFAGNQAHEEAGALRHNFGKALCRNCTFSGNRSLSFEGHDIFCDIHSNITLLNCIAWDGDTAPVSEIFLANVSAVEPYPPVLSVRYSDIEGGQSTIHVGDRGTLTWGPGNTDIDPLFASPGHWDLGAKSGIPYDDTWIDGDYHLKSQAGRWSPNDGQWTIDETTSPCVDAGDPISPIGLEPFPNGGRVNMGAYGGTSEASKSYFGGPPCQTIVAGDINGDCKVDFKDFAFITMNWLRDENP